jgi:hypothetical protein
MLASLSAPPLREEHMAFLQVLVRRMTKAGFTRARIFEEVRGHERIFGITGTLHGNNLEASVAATSHESMCLGLNQLAEMLDATIEAGTP